MKTAPLLAFLALVWANPMLATERNKDWAIGPRIHGKNYSVGMPTTMHPDHSGPSLAFPTRDSGIVKYITMPTSGLHRANELTIRYRIDAAPNVRIVAQERPSSPALLSVYFQRRGDNWSARGKYAYYRWYASSAKTLPLTPGGHSVTLNFEDDWVGVMGASAKDTPAFREALIHADRVGFVFGAEGGRGHGVYATGPAKFTLLDFDVR